MEIQEDNKLISDFNEAKLQIMRLNSLWASCHHHSSSGNFQQWNWKLDRIYTELTVDMDDEDNEEDSKQKDSYFNKIETINSKILKTDERDKLYNLIMDKERILRRLQNAAGKGSKKKRADEDLMD